ncbi:MAG: monocarboxylate uptake permease MctP [Terriglobales bacterium]
MNFTAAAVFAACLLSVTVLGLWAARWRPADLHGIEEWALGGRRFGAVLTWFLIGGDFYSAYTIIAVPALVYGVGAMGFFALVYTILVYPFVYLVMPRLWRVSRRRDYTTLADFVRGRYGSRPLASAIAITGILATLPYLALQLLGMQVAIAALGFRSPAAASDVGLFIAFLILAAYDYVSGLRAPAIVAIAKDAMVYIVILAAVIWIPIRLGGYGHIFHVAAAMLATHHPAGALMLKPQQFLAFATLALGSGLAAFLYPHTATSILSAASDRAIERNAVFLPAYTFLLGLIALLGYVALAAGIHSANRNSIVPALFTNMFPAWFAGFAMAAIAVGALVPAAIMAIACGTLFTRNLWREYVNPQLSPQQESRLAKLISLLLKLAAVAFVIFGDQTYAINLQLLGGIWILQTFPAVIFGLYRRWLHPAALVIGWALGMAVGTAMGWAMGLRTSVYPLHFAGLNIAAYAAVDAVVANLAAAVLLTVLFRRLRLPAGADETAAGDYERGPRVGERQVAAVSTAKSS